MDEIKVLIVDDVKETRDNLRTLLSFENRINVIGEAENGEQAVEMTMQLNPHIVVMDVNMPVMDGIRATEIITKDAPQTTVIIMSVQGETEYLRKAMTAGARDYLSKPFSAEDLITTVTHLFESECYKRERKTVPEEEMDGKLIAVFSAKGGEGKSTIASNIATLIAKDEKEKVALVDLDLLFGIQNLLLNLQPKATIMDLVREIENIDHQSIKEYMIEHYSGVSLLPSISKPEYAEFITGKHIDTILAILKKSFKYVVVDLPHGFTENNLAVFDMADKIIMITCMDLASVKNTKSAIDLMESLQYTKERIILVANNFNESFGISILDIEGTLNFNIDVKIIKEEQTFITSINKGIPFVLKRSETKAAKSIQELTKLITGYKGIKNKEDQITKKASLVPSFLRMF